MLKSGYEDSRWHRKDESHHSSHSRKLDLRIWAFSWPDERSDRNSASRASQIKPVIRGVNLLPCSISDGLLSSFNLHRSPLSKFSIFSLEPTRVAEILKDWPTWYREYLDVDVLNELSTGAKWVFDKTQWRCKNYIMKLAERLKGWWKASQRSLAFVLWIWQITYTAWIITLFTWRYTCPLYCTLGASQPGDDQRLDPLVGPPTKRFMLHWNFPEFSINEVGQLLNLHCSTEVA